MSQGHRPAVRFFAGRGELRSWFEEHHADGSDLWIGYYKRGSRKTGLTYTEAVEEALCFGWIDGQVRAIDEVSYANRYTPRRAGSRWSRRNVERVESLIKAGQVRPAGLAAYRSRDPKQPAGYSFEESPRVLPRPLLSEFKAARPAWSFFRAQTAYYRRSAIFWVTSARHGDTRRRRLRILIEESKVGRRLNLLSPGSH